MSQSGASVVYIHGAGVRDPAPTAALIRAGLEARGVPTDVVALAWAAQSGPGIPRIDRFIPRPTLGMGPFETETLGDARTASIGAGELRRSLIDEADRFEAAQPDAHAVASAVRAVAESSALQRIARSSSRGDPALPAAVRELVRARVIAEAPDIAAEHPSLVSRLLCAIVERLAALGPRGAEWCPTLSGADVPRWVTGELRHCRAALMEPSVDTLTDVFHYLRRGAAARRLARRTIERLQGPCVVVGESLGGIVATDALADRPPRHARGLVTVGSQVAVLHAMDALASLRPGGGRAPFTPWLNVYSEYDFASFLARPGWPEVDGIEDVEVDDATTGFPESHSRYWHIPATLDRLAGFLRRVLT